MHVLHIAKTGATTLNSMLDQSRFNKIAFIGFHDTFEWAFQQRARFTLERAARLRQRDVLPEPSEGADESSALDEVAETDEVDETDNLDGEQAGSVALTNGLGDRESSTDPGAQRASTPQLAQ